MYYNKKPMFRLSEFAKISKNVLLYGTQAQSSMPKMNYQVKIDPKTDEKPVAKVAVTVAVPESREKVKEKDLAAQIDLQQAIIWSEIIGKPMCKRRERRYYGN